MKTNKNYLIDPDPTLKQAIILIILVWIFTIFMVWLIIAKPKILNPVVYEVNGVMPGSDYVWGEIPNK